MGIKNITARWILDSRGTPTVEADVWLSNGLFGRAAVPSGASTGSHEAHELRDGGQAFGGKGVMQAIGNIEGEINGCLKGVPADDQFLLDDKMIKLDGTESKSRLGANAILAVSLASAQAAAKTRALPLYQHINDIAGNPAMILPMPMMNVLNGGKHASHSSDFQEFMIVPLAANKYSGAVRIGAEIFMALKQELNDRGQSTAVGDEGGFTYPVSSNTEMLDLLNIAAQTAGYQPGREVGFAIDVAASEFFKDGKYILATEQRQLDAAGMIDYLDSISKSYALVSIEDGLDQDAWADWQTLTEKIKLQLVGDDLLVTNPTRLGQAIDQKAGNAILIKPNQIGTLTETIKTIQLAQANSWRTVVSHRSGETEDTTIAHLAVGTGAGQIKTGSLSRTERTAKHNELMRIEAGDQNLAFSHPFN